MKHLWMKTRICLCLITFGISLCILCIGTVSADDVITDDGRIQGNTTGYKLDKEDHWYAFNPTHEELLKFLKTNNVDENEYVDPEYTCGEFAQDLHNDAEADWIKGGFVSIQTDDGSFKHIFNMFETTDAGTVYVDCIGGDYIVTFENGCYIKTSIDDPADIRVINFAGSGVITYAYGW